jgi:O-antigen/teichoic acid export membrane protein
MPPAALAAEPVTRRVIASTRALLLRSAWERALSLVATLAVARLLVPKDLGLAALVLTITAFATAVVDGGITISFMRLPQAPTAEQFCVARKAQFAIAVAMIAIAASVSAFSGVLGILLVVDCLQLLTDPFVLQPKVMLQRELEFGGLAVADALGVLARAATSLAIAVVYPSALALVLGDLCAAVVIATGIVGVLGPKAPKPQAGLQPVSAIDVLRDGMRFQGFTFILALRDLSSASLISGLVGLRALGVFQFAQRVLSPVLVVFTSLTQIAVPVGVRVIQGAEVAGRRVRQGYLVSGLVTAGVLAVVAAPSHWLVPAVFGKNWIDATPLIAALALALVINGPACTFGVGLILAANKTRFATIAAAACSAFFVATLAALHEFGGLGAISVAWVTSAVVEAAIVVTACKRLLGIALGWATIVPVPVFGIAYTAGYWGGKVASGWLMHSVVAAACACLVAMAVATPIGWRSAREIVLASRGAPEPTAPLTSDDNSLSTPEMSATPA